MFKHTPTSRLTDDTVAENLKQNYEGLQLAGYEPDISDLRYVKLAEYERTGWLPDEIKPKENT